jgi:hypothetical protein
MKNNTSLETFKKNYLLIPRPQEAEKDLKSIFGKVLKELNNEKLINSEIKEDLIYLIEDYFDSQVMMSDVAEGHYSDNSEDDNEFFEVSSL